MYLTQFLGINYFWGSTRKYPRTFFIDISTCDLFFIINEIDVTSYVDDNISFVTRDNIEDVFESYENDSMKLSKWFADNKIKTNKSKCHLFISSDENSTINMDGNIIEKSNCEKIFSVNNDYIPNFYEYLDSIIKKVGRKVKVLPFFFLKSVF